ncbi:imm11 family protein [Pseudomonas sp. PS02290]|uniref:imm11 family protein n=1 Tax=Pseudomonas sp. PS02290 TaxID=2991430 RepID=UPI00249CA35B|nr:hypothetical protein [Pseudomonas sp. PS02290]
MKYFILRHEDINGRFIDGDVEFSPPLTNYYQVGKEVLPAETKIRLTLDRRVKKIDSDFFLTSCGAFFISAAMRKVLDEFKTSLVIHPVNLMYHDGKAVEAEYFLIHQDFKVRCFDYQNSDYSGKNMVLAKLSHEELSPEYLARGIKKLCIVERQADNNDFLFVDQIIWIDPLISEAVVESAKRNGVKLNVQPAC